jgi:N-acetylmuramic acid 6-phosphate etherase
MTEQANSNSANIDSLPTLDLLRVINVEDARVALAVQSALPAIAQAVDSIAEKLRQGGRLIYIGAGTSGRLAVLDAVECVPTYGTPPELVQGIIAGGPTALTQSIEGAEDSPAGGAADLKAVSLSARDVVCGVAASGETPYTLGALAYANSLNAVTIGIACNSPSSLLELARIPIAVPVGPEVIAGSTRMKAGTAQKLVLNMLSTGTMIRLGKVYGNLMVDVQATNQKLVHRARRLVSQLAEVDLIQAQALLDQSGGEVKTAIVMQRREVDAAQARQLLQGVEGQLRRLIDPA